jgi:glycosyltransferase involved in cell wall biosynthesis
VTKLIIQIPCYDEEETLAETLASLPRVLPGIDVIETLVIDDGSTDATSDVARRAGVTYLLRFPRNQGLARAFSAGLDAALKLGADVIVNTDADNQYRGDEIGKLVRPILEGRADMVVGDRAPYSLPHFGFWKRVLQRLGSWTVRLLSGTTVPDATSGFRAFSRRAALRLNVLSEFTYTLETIIQAGKKQIPIAYVPVHARAVGRPSRLFLSVSHYLRRSVATLVRTFALYEPLKFFGVFGATLVSLGLIIAARFVWYYFTEGGAGHIQSLILSAILIIVGFQTLQIALVADLIGSSRRLLEDALLRVRKLELEIGNPEVDYHDGVLNAPAPAPEPGARRLGGRGA